MNSISFYLITDSHYVSKQIWTEGKPFTFREREDQIALKRSPEILDCFIERIIADKDTDTVIFTGDNVNGGDMASHFEFKKRLETLKEAGKRVFVIYATHDYCGMGDDENFFKAVKYSENKTEPVPYMPKAELFDFYYEYGPKQALSVHRESGSYSVKLGEGVRLIAISDNGNGRSHCGLFDDGMKWLENEIKKAKAEGESVILATHHPVIPPTPVYSHIAEFEMLGGYKEIIKIMCENGVRVIFTGHTHIQSIQKYTDGNGNSFYDIATTALVNAAGKMRKVDIDSDSKECSVTSIGNDKIPFEELYYINFPGIWEKLLPLASENFSAFIELAEGYLPVDKLKRHKAAIKTVSKTVSGIKLSAAAKLGGVWKMLTESEKQSAKNALLTDCVFEIFRHIFTGNAPFTPDTIQYKAVNGVIEKADKFVNVFNIKKIKSIIPEGSSLAEIARGFLYNNRTGDDDAISFCLEE